MTNNDVWTVKRLLEWAISFFKNKEIPSPRLSAEILLSHVLNQSRMELYLKHDYTLKEEELKKYKSLILRRLEHEPIQYITGTAYFRKISLEVKNCVLIPRPETEILVDCAREAIEKIVEVKNANGQAGSALNILEIGTGSGAVSISILSEHPEKEDGFFPLNIAATDIDAAAIEIARKNILSQIRPENKAGHIDLFECDIVPENNLKFKKEYIEKTDLIISNPPYISDENYKNLSKEVKDYEPETALRAGRTGLEVYEKIFTVTMPYISKEKAFIILETDPCLKEDLSAMALKIFGNEKIKILFKKDYNNLDRVCIIEF